MKYDKLSRRVFLQGMGGAVLGLPILEGLVPKGAQAATPGGPRHLVAIKTSSGRIPHNTYPQRSVGNKYRIRGGEVANPGYSQDGTVELTDNLLSTANRERAAWNNDFKAAPLSEFADSSNGISRIMGTRFNPYLNQMSILRGLDYQQEFNHNSGGTLGHFNTNVLQGANLNQMTKWETIDQLLAKVAPYRDKRYPSLYLAPNYVQAGAPGVNANGNQDGYPGSSFRLLSNGEFEVTPVERNPRALFDRLFALNPNTGGGGGSTPSSPAIDRVKNNISLLDLVLPELTLLTRSAKWATRLSTQDKQNLDQHATYLADLQRRLNRDVGGGSTGGGGGSGGSGCATPTAPNSIDTLTFDPALLRKTVQDMVDVACAAIRCGLTDIICFEVTSAVCLENGTGREVVRVHYPSGNIGRSDWHGLAHTQDNPDSYNSNGLIRRELEQLERFVAEEVFLRFMTNLNTIEAGSSTYLYNSLVWWGSELSYNHCGRSIPTILGGELGGRLKMGRYIDYSDWSQVHAFMNGGAFVSGISYNRFLTAVLMGMGLAPNEYEKGGRPGFGDTNLFGNHIGPDNYVAALNGTPPADFLRS